MEIHSNSPNLYYGFNLSVFCYVNKMKYTLAIEVFQIHLEENIFYRLN